MSTIKYANAVAAVKAMENNLLSRSDMEQLINAPGKNDFENLLNSKKGNSVFSEETVWEMIHGYAPDSKELEILLYKNDFHNIKAALKSMVSDKNAEGYYIRPTNLDLNTLSDIMRDKSYENLPEYIRDTARDAYDLIVRTSDGQRGDTFIDTACLTAMQKSADEFGGDMIKNYAQLITLCADIKSAYRCSKMKKQRSFIEDAVCGSDYLDKDALVDSALDGTESLLVFLEENGCADAAELLKQSAAQFEKWCDDKIMELAQSARMLSFGSEPLAAYYIAAEAEIKNLRIISVCREFGADRNTITERMRELYV